MSSKVKHELKAKKFKTDSDSEAESEHELFHYANDRVKLMKHVLRLIKPKQIKAIAPDFMKNLDIEEINSLLLEELLGISNKRLKRILDGVNVDNDSSTDSEVEQEAIDIISLDDISDDEIEDDFESIYESKTSGSKTVKNKGNKSKKKSKDVEVKQECAGDKERLMSVLEILELQARARAIRSQLALENSSKSTEVKLVAVASDDDSDDVIVEVPKNEEIVISSSDSENETGTNEKPVNDKENTTSAIENNNKESSGEDIKKGNIDEDNISKGKEVDKNIEKGNCVEDNTDKKKNQSDKIREDDRNNRDQSIEEKSTPAYVANEHDDAVIINLDEMEFEEIEK